jgi:hypothetical protein
MTMEHGQQESAAELEDRPQERDEIEASIAALEKAMLGPPPARDREGIHELGCRIVAQAIMNNK